jgi:hypothetical protein
MPIFKNEGQQWRKGNLSCAALAAFHWTAFFNIEDEDWSVIFRLHTGRSQPLDSWQQSFASDSGLPTFCNRGLLVSGHNRHWLLELPRPTTVIRPVRYPVHEEA